MLKVSSPIGKELDSLADLVTFGVLPGFMMLIWMRNSDLPALVPFIAFLIPVFSALRLANFNVDERQSTEFIGLPTPANALFISSLVFVADSPIWWLRTDYALIAVTLVFSYLLVSPVRMFSLKTTSFGWKGNELRIIFLALCIALFALFRLSAFPMIIMMYVVISIFFNRKTPHNEITKETF
jgi:CDP-diacylglycerol--serine O-phosphatidyltransferase